MNKFMAVINNGNDLLDIKHSLVKQQANNL